MASDNEQADGQQTTEANESTQNDPLHNFKSEVSRKLGNTDKAMGDLLAQNRQLSDQLKSLTERFAPRREEPTEDLESLAYSDPKRYAARVKDEATQAATRAVSEMTAANQQKAAVLNSLYRDYPELSDEGSELTQKAVQIYGTLSDDEKRSPAAYKLAVREAAAELGVLTQNKRKAPERDSDDFVAPGSRGATAQSRRKAQSDELHPDILASAELFGLNVNDPAQIERLKKRAKRTNWSRFQGE